MSRWLPIVAVALVAAALRLWHFSQGLPDFVEEAIPLRRALEMWGWDTSKTDWNPHLFHYPSLSFYLHFGLQKLGFALGHWLGRYPGPADYLVSFHLDPTPMVLAGRAIGVASDLSIVAAVAVIGDRIRRGAGILAAILVAIAPGMILNARSIYVDGIMAAFSLWALQRALAWQAEGRVSTLLQAAILIGLAAGTKYPAGLLVGLLVWVVFERRGVAGVPLAQGATLLSLVVFAVTSHFLLLYFASFRRDLSDMGHLAREGHFGSLGQVAFLHYGRGLLQEVGWVGTVFLVGSLALLRGPRGDARPALLVWLFLLAFALPVAFSSVRAERYLVPIVPAAALVSAIALSALVDRFPTGRRVGAAAVLAALVLAPVVAGGVRAARSGSDTTQLQARRWLEKHLSAHEVLVQEEYGARLTTVREVQELARRPVFQRASPEWQQRFLSRPVFRVVGIPLAVSGRIAVRVPVAGGAEAELEVAPQVSTMSRIFYDPRLLNGVDYVLTSSAVRGRYEADSIRYPVERAFYRVLDESGTRAARFVTAGGTVGPEILIHRLDESSWSAILARFGRLDSDWWTAFVPPDYRERVDASADRSRWNVESTADGAVSPWRSSLQPLFSSRIRTFAYDLSRHLAELGRLEAAMPLARSIVDELPRDAVANDLFVWQASRVGAWEDARDAMERRLELADPASGDDPAVRLSYAQLLAQTGDLVSARREARRVLDAAGVDEELRSSALRLEQALSARLDGSRSSRSPANRPARP